MAKRSQKSRFGPSKDRIKPDTDSAETAESDDDQADDTADDTADESEEPKAGEGGGGNKNDDQDGAEGEAHDDEPDESAGEPDNDAPGDESVDDLASAYISEEGDQNPQTCCSSCHTVFEVSRELLESSDTRVRCGECLSIFDALANLRKSADEDEDVPLDSDEADTDTRSSSADKPEHAVQAGAPDADAATQAGSSSNGSPLDVTYADFALFSADAGLPEMEYLDETREVPPFDFDDLGDEDDFDESIDETLYAEDVIEDARAALGDGNSEQTGTASQGDVDDPKSADSQTVAEEGAVGDIDELLNSLKKPELPIITAEEPVAAWWFRGLLFMGVLILAAGLYGYRERDALQNNHLVRPVLESVCAVFGCSLPERVDLTALKVTKRTVFSHPDVDDRLIINIGFVNQAEFSQRYPTLEILLTDRSGRLIVRHDYEPSDYLDNWQVGDVLDVGKSLDISLSMKDPGNEAMSFELDFR